MIALREYQSRTLENLRRKIIGGTRKLVVVAPTGSGKTVMAAQIVRSAVDKGKRVAFVAHRKELVDQTVGKLGRFDVSAGVIMAADKRRDDFLPVQVCSIQTLARRLDRLPPADIVIADECHHAASATWKKVMAAYPDAIFVGLTATPWRSDRLGLGDIFDDHVLTATPRELMDSGDLVGYEAFAYDAPDLHEVRITAGDFNEGDLELACNTAVLVGNVVREYLEHASGRSAIVFPVTIEHSKNLVEQFRANGVDAEHIDCTTKKDVRASALERFKSGALKVISSVGILTEGFDAPSAEVCVLARPTKSLSLHLQMIGRVLRPAPGKTRALIHDHAGNLLRNGLPDDERDWSLANTPRSVLARKVCPCCVRLVERVRPDGTCPHCGELIAQPADLCGRCALPKDTCVCEARERAELEQIAGKRISVDEIRAMRAAKGIARELSDRQLAKVAGATRAEKIGEYLRLQSVQQRKGLKKGFVYHQFREVFGHAPSFSHEELQGKVPADRPFLPLPPRENWTPPGGWPPGGTTLPEICRCYLCGAPISDAMLEDGGRCIACRSSSQVNQ